MGVLENFDREKEKIQQRGKRETYSAEGRECAHPPGCVARERESFN
jgi:hypothetical protein